MTAPTFTPTRFQNGIWEGLISADSEPQIEALYLAEPLSDVTLEPVAEGWALQVKVPLAALSDGVHTIIIQEAVTRQKLGDVTIISGAPAADDMRAEIALLRAELDMLKQVVRRSHNPET